MLDIGFNPIGDDGILLLINELQYNCTLLLLCVAFCDITAKGNYSMVYECPKLYTLKFSLSLYTVQLYHMIHHTTAPYDTSLKIYSNSYRYNPIVNLNVAQGD